jgi:hypothetical protein
MDVVGRILAMGSRRRTGAPAPPGSGPEPVGPPVDLARFERLVEASVRARELGIDFRAIERRAAADDVSFNEALEAIEAELRA